MSAVAFTVGYAKGYDSALAKATALHPLVKVGKNAKYDGGWVWATREEAERFLRSQISPQKDYAVYRIELPTDWDTDVSPKPNRIDGVHCLLNDAIVVERDS